jgi:hypothetical protein
VMRGAWCAKSLPDAWVSVHAPRTTHHVPDLWPQKP